MKCEKCNEREATFFYSSNYNGRRSERHLCSQCAHEEGFGEMLKPGAMFDSAFDSMFEDFFAPIKSFMSLPAFDMFGGMGRSIMAPAFPRLRLVIDEKQEAAPAPAPAEVQVDESVRLEREREALRAQLEEAVKEENYEKAIELRDKLREMGK